MVEKDNDSCDDPYDFGDSNKYKENTRWVWDKVIVFVSQNRKKYSKHEKKSNSHGECKVGLKPCTEGKI